ncbi:Transcription factor [Morus notabilis]|uniref:Transcription factor n=1 Tax=Morus notabilis TaxID=981085 RepID=W9QL74_9ROSA|nr:transcription factor MYB1R1 [Morus notabilis]EXB29768.1 Transcription factor [Morus notabilis]
MSLTCSSKNDPPVALAGGEDSGVGEFMLFGVRVVVDSMRKSVSLNNLSQYEQPQESAINNSPNTNNNNTGNGKDDVAPGYTSENDVVHNSGGNRERERRRGIPWTEEEHKLFLLGLQKVGKGDWRGISRNFVKTRTPTQVASHAQKYFLRRNNHNRRRRRSSLFDITTDTVAAIPMEEDQAVHHQENVSQSHPLPLSPEPCNPGGFSLVPTCPVSTVGSSVLPTPVENPMEKLTLGQTNPETTSSPKLVRPIALLSIPHGTATADLSLNLKSAIDPSALSLKLSLPSDPRESSSARHSAFQSMSSFNNGDSIITVA